MGTARKFGTALLAAAWLAAALPGAARAAGWLEGAVLSVGEGLGWRAAHEAGDGAYERVKGAVLHPDRGDGGGTGSGREGRKGGNPGWGKKGAPRPEEAPFVPGGKTIFADDFRSVPPSAFPPRWTPEGPKGTSGNVLETVTWDGMRFLRSRPVPHGRVQDTSVAYARLRPGTVLPQRFTVEFDALLGYPESTVFGNDPLPDEYVILLHRGGGRLNGSGFHDPGEITVSGKGIRTRGAESPMERSDGGLHRVAVAVDGTAARVWIDGSVVHEDPRAVSRPVHAFGLALVPGGGESTERLMVTNVRLAEGGCPDPAGDGGAAEGGTGPGPRMRPGAER